MTQGIPKCSRRSQQGGLTIVMALILVGVMGAAAFSLSRSAIRELSMAGSLIQGDRAAAVADAGLDWVVIWGQGKLDPAGFTGATPSGSQMALLANITKSQVSPYPTVIALGDADPAMSLNQAGVAQNFDIEMRLMGQSTPPGGSTISPTTAGGDWVWRVVSTGRATPTGGQTFQAQRELIVSLPN